MKKILDIFDRLVSFSMRKRKIASLGSIQIVEIDGYYKAIGGSFEERAILRQYLSINLNCSFNSIPEHKQNQKLLLLVNSL
ncbi:MAG: hypothetical protein J6U77_07070 [Verrucomicrobia bacterium]|jgi:hypothetical protein|nr:hypothetical protein [Verrucomicrobiota bacterium]MBR4248754.1 hypothetical protein [Verrucomicrobiota bacterium]